MKRLFGKGRYANVTSTLALVVALGGTGAYAANTIGSADIRNGAVRSADIGNGQVRGADLARSALTTDKVRDGSLLARDFSPGQLFSGARGTLGPAGAPGAPGPRGAQGPPGPKGDPGTVDTSAFHTKAASDARYLRKTITVIRQDTAPAKTFAAQRADCPSGYEALGGGVDVDNVVTMAATSSGPVVNNLRTMGQADGQHPAATGWQGTAMNTNDTAKPFVVSVICAPVG